MSHAQARLLRTLGDICDAITETDISAGTGILVPKSAHCHNSCWCCLSFAPQAESSIRMKTNRTLIEVLDKSDCLRQCPSAKTWY